MPVTHLPHEEAEEAEECVHQANIVGDASDDGLLAVWTHRLHRRGLKHLPLQYSHGGGRPCGCQDGRCVAPHMGKVTGCRAKLSWHRMWEMTGWRVEATWRTNICIFKYCTNLTGIDRGGMCTPCSMVAWAVTYWIRSG